MLGQANGVAKMFEGKPSHKGEHSGIGQLLGRTLVYIFVNDEEDEVCFRDSDGIEYKMHHKQDCCEGVNLLDVNGDWADLLGNPILVAKEEEFEKGETGTPGPPPDHYEPDSYTWTYYHLATIAGSVSLRWYGSSNGYYSESVDFVRLVN